MINFEHKHSLLQYLKQPQQQIVVDKREKTKMEPPPPKICLVDKTYRM
ncbi:Uncharacterized protein APZ42_003330 [Daphnia magna]|uniref:Uncharacterized protein n=1 Tax=Daphnia magna TaxID=35525 RepID=A0A164HM29_9CRUS|nr:Uncharacterized protein APZ42_003330 [Daphnia magna]